MRDASQDVIPFYERNIKNWKRERNCSLFEKHWLDRFLAHIPLAGNILDLGCGTGCPIADYFIGKGYHVTGVDSSPAMITEARRLYPDHDWVIQDMRKVDLSERYDGIIAWDSFFHLTPADQKSVFKIFARHLKTGAPLIFTAGQEQGGEVANKLWDALLYHASLSKDEYYNLFEEHGFDQVVNVFDDPQCGGHTIYMAVKAVV